MGALVDSRRTRTAAGALLELSGMANEKLLLEKELERWKYRHREIQKRLAEIAAKEQRLMTFVKYGPALVDAMPAPAGATPAPVGATPAPIDFHTDGRFKVEEFTY